MIILESLRSHFVDVLVDIRVSLAQGYKIIAFQHQQAATGFTVGSTHSLAIMKQRYFTEEITLGQVMVVITNMNSDLSGLHKKHATGLVSCPKHDLSGGGSTHPNQTGNLTNFIGCKPFEQG